MTHALVVKAHGVSTDVNSYPETIVADAQIIVDWSQAKRIDIRALWEKHFVLQQWIALRGNQRDVRR